MIVHDVLLGLAALLAGWGVATLVLRERYPRLYWVLVGIPVCWVRIMWTWRAVCVQLGWVAQKNSGRTIVNGLIVRGQELRPKVPRLWVTLTRNGAMVARVRMLPGQIPGEFGSGVEALAHAWRVHSVRVDSLERGFVRIAVVPADPLGDAVEYAPLETRDLGPSSPARLNLALVVGIRESGSAWDLDLRRIPHWLIVGATQSGKSTLLRALVARLSELPVALVGIDLKGGLELSLYGPRLSALATDKQEAADVLTGLLGVLLDRMAACRAAGVVTVWQLPDPPPAVVVIVDEIAELYLGDRSEKDVRERATSALVRIAQLGAALGVHVIVAGQRVGSDLGPGLTMLRAQLAGRVLLRVADPETAQMVLGDQAPEAVAMAMMIGPEHPGFAVAADESGGWGRVRVALTSLDQAKTAAERFAFLRVVLAGLTPPARLDDETGGA